MPTAAKIHRNDEPAGRNREGYNYKHGLSSSSSASRLEAARAAAAEAEAAEPYVPLMPAWKQVARGADRELLRNLKLELTTVEDQVGRGWHRGREGRPGVAAASNTRRNHFSVLCVACLAETDYRVALFD